MFIDANTSREVLMQAWNEHCVDMVDTAIRMNIDPDMPETGTEDIRRLILTWIEAGDECAAA